MLFNFLVNKKCYPKVSNLSDMAILNEIWLNWNIKGVENKVISCKRQKQSVFKLDHQANKRNKIFCYLAS